MLIAMNATRNQSRKYNLDILLSSLELVNREGLLYWPSPLPPGVIQTDKSPSLLTPGEPGKVFYYLLPYLGAGTITRITTGALWQAATTTLTMLLPLPSRNEFKERCSVRNVSQSSLVLNERFVVSGVADAWPPLAECVILWPSGNQLWANAEPDKTTSATVIIDFLNIFTSPLVVKNIN